VATIINFQPSPSRIGLNTLTLAGAQPDGHSVKAGVKARGWSVKATIKVAFLGEQPASTRAEGRYWPDR
jgi:hypothetical protein